VADDDPHASTRPGRTRRVAPAAADAASTRDRVAAFSEFYRAELAGVVSLVILHGATLVEAADAAQTAMVQAWRQWDQLTHPRAWVRTVAQRTHLNSIPRREALTESPPELPALATDVALEISEQVETVLGLLTPLPDQQRLVMVWSMYGFTDEEIAHELGTTPTAVRQSRQRARKTLKQRIQHPGKGGDV
jgi:RNA polymerase sigma factor (sigma-70 family)